jgi:hypothetical protein
METAKVDIRKLQMLNDCINRTIEALNQVRLSVHAGGLSHTAPIGFAGAIGNPYLPYPNALLNGLVTGFGNTPAISPQYATQFANQYNPQYQYAPQMFGWAQQGLGHTGVQPFNTVGQAFNTLGQDWVDPYATARIAQTFPFVHWGYSPFAWPTV